MLPQSRAARSARLKTWGWSIYIFGGFLRGWEVLHRKKNERKRRETKNRAERGGGDIPFEDEAGAACVPARKAKKARKAGEDEIFMATVIDRRTVERRVKKSGRRGLMRDDRSRPDEIRSGDQLERSTDGKENTEKRKSHSQSESLFR